jgi:hypothetical protein
MSRLNLTTAGLALGLVVVAPLGAQQTKVRGFVDFKVRATGDRSAPSHFELGQLDLFITSKLSPRLSLLSEVVGEYDRGEFGADLERLQLTFALTHRFEVLVGRHHNPIGYWNDAHHHGSVFDPTIERPVALRFEDDGGVLPIHVNGVAVAGNDLTRLHLGFKVVVANGLGSTATEDNNQAKSVTGAVSSQLTSRLRIGISAYTDQLSAGTLNPAGLPLGEALGFDLFGGFVHHEAGRTEATVEVFRTRTAPRGVPAAWGTLGYGYLGVRFGQLTPYVRGDLYRIGSADRYLEPDRFTSGLVGIRFDPSALTVIKFEAGRESSRLRGRHTEVRAQLAIGF